MTRQIEQRRSTNSARVSSQLVTALLSFVWVTAAAQAAAPVVTTNRGDVLTKEFVGRSLGMEGTALSCRALGDIAFVVAPLERAYVAHVGETEDRQLFALQVACEAARACGASEDSVFVPRRQRAEIAHFLLVQGNDLLFGKAIRPKDEASGWPEPFWSRFAAERGFAPLVQDTPGIQHVLLTQFLPFKALSRVQSFAPQRRRQLLALLRAIHRSESPRIPQQPATPIGAAWARLQDAEHAGFLSPLSLSDLRARLDYIDEAMRDLPVFHTVCHGDPAVGNTLASQAGLLYIDWEAAGWDDPFRDVARLISNSQWPHESLPGVLGEYLERPATDQEVRHLALLVAAFDIDHYGAARAATGVDSVYVTRFARRVHRGHSLLPELPEVRMTASEGES